MDDDYDNNEEDGEKVNKEEELDFIEGELIQMASENSLLKNSLATLEQAVQSLVDTYHRKSKKRKEKSKQKKKEKKNRKILKKVIDDDDEQEKEKYDEETHYGSDSDGSVNDI